MSPVRIFCAVVMKPAAARLSRALRTNAAGVFLLAAAACILLASAGLSGLRAQGRESRGRVMAKIHKERYRAWKIKSEVAQDDSTGRTTLIEYDTLGNKIREIVYRGDSTTEQVSGYRYDGGGVLLLETTITRPSDRQAAGSARVQYTYNEADDPTHIVQLAPDGTPVATSEFIYNPAGKIEKMRTLRGKGGLLLNVAMRYDTAGNMVEAVGTDSAGRVTSRTVYAYDDSGNVLQQSSFTGTGQRINRLAFTYDTSGNVLSIINYDAADSVVGTTANTYDAGENIVESISSGPGGQSVMRTSFSYDAEGKLTEVTTTNKEGTVVRKVRYTYKKWE